MYAALSNLLLALNAALFGLNMANHNKLWATIYGLFVALLCISKINVDILRERVLMKQHLFICEYIEARKKSAAGE